MDTLNEIARALRALHSRLLACGRAEYLREHPEAGEIGTGEMLILATQGAEFAWLRSLSELMTEIDELRDDAHTANDPDLQAAVRTAVEELVSSHAQAATPFQERYWRFVHEDPNVAMAHAGLRQALQALPFAPAGGRRRIAQHLAANPRKSRGRK